ncbi:MMPL family transporter [Saccharopolyspora shandongensis]|uniref:MMPL family transporter n=1 Tax=Saccharopolyspora shandongensis TaxID=418495 RepID=UPI0033C06DA3
MILAFAVVFLVLAGMVSSGLTSQLKTGGLDDPKSESSQAQEFLDSHFADSPNLANLVLMATTPIGQVDDPAVTEAGTRLTERVTKEPGMAKVTSYWTTHAPDLRSKDGRSALLLVHVGGAPEKAAEHAKKLTDKLADEGGPLQVRPGGKVGVKNDINKHVEDDLTTSESFAVPLTLVLLVVAFGSVVAALLPLSIGIVSILGTLLALFLLSKVTDVSVYALNVATAFGLGLAIDFGLLMVSRFREERDAGLDHQQAVVEAVAKAGRTILFSSATVSVAVSGMLIFPVYFLRSIALAASAVVLVAAVGAVVVLPALLVVFGRRLESMTLFRRHKSLSSDSQFWRRTAAAIMRRPVLSALPVLLLLLVMGIPFLHAKFAPSDEHALPTDSVSRQATTALRRDFPVDNSQALTVVAPQDGKALDGMAKQISGMNHVSRVDGAFGSYVNGALVAPPGPQSTQFTSGNTGYMLVSPDVDPQSDAAQDLVKAVRTLSSPGGTEILTAGPTAALIDSTNAIADSLWPAIGLMTAATFILLFLFTGSVVLPLKALALNVFMLSAVLGVMVWLFQDGNLIGWLGTTPTPMNTAMVVVLLCLSFGLSVDYEMFLLSRIKEAHDSGTSTTDSVVEGLGRVGRIVSTAAALLCVTLFSFSIGISFMQMFGLGTGLAVLLDATLVRGVLVPAFMRVAGEYNWWAPRPLRWLHNRIGIAEAPSSPAAVTTAKTSAPATREISASPFVAPKASEPSRLAGGGVRPLGPGNRIVVHRSRIRVQQPPPRKAATVEFIEPFAVPAQTPTPEPRRTDTVREPAATVRTPSPALRFALRGEEPSVTAPQRSENVLRLPERRDNPTDALEFEVTMGPAVGSRISVDSEELVLGRNAESVALFGDDPKMSRRHALLRRTATGYVVEDLRSVRGTFVNRVRIGWPTALRSGDELEFGGVQLRVVADVRAAAA